MQRTTCENHPIIAGVGQITGREKIRHANKSFIDLAAQAIDLCAKDTARPDILKQVDAITVVSPVCENRESPVPRICARMGIDPRIQEETTFGGNYGQWVVNRAADGIMAGEYRVVLLTGGEALYNDTSFVQDIHANVTRLYGRYARDGSILGDLRRAETPYEVLHNMDRALHIYPLFENALRAHLNMSPPAYRAFLKHYYASMDKAARGNSYAWFNQGKPALDITEPTDKNPLINYPYTKFMNPIMAVNQAAAVIMTDTRTALELGIPAHKWVYLHGSAEGTDTWYISHRQNYYSSPIARLTAQAAMQCAGVDLSGISFFDLYSCFPCAAIISAMEMGMPVHDLPPLSITGGLSYFGGPGGNYSMHAIAHAVERLRQAPAESGLITAWGNYLTKHSVAIYSGQKPAKAWDGTAHISLDDPHSAAAHPAVCEKPLGEATIETYTVLHDDPGRGAYAIIIARLDTGERCLACTRPGSDLAAQMEQNEFVGYQGYITPGDGGPNIFS